MNDAYLPLCARRTVSTAPLRGFSFFVEREGGEKKEKRSSNLPQTALPQYGCQFDASSLALVLLFCSWLHMHRSAVTRYLRKNTWGLAAFTLRLSVFGAKPAFEESLLVGVSFHLVRGIHCCVGLIRDQ